MNHKLHSCCVFLFILTTLSYKMAMKKESFITTEDFNALTAPHFQEETIFWKDLPIQVIFKVEHVYLLQTKWGKQLVLVLTNHEGKIFQVYATNPIKNELKDIGKNLATTTYIKSLGEKKITTNTGNRKYYDYEIVLAI